MIIFVARRLVQAMPVMFLATIGVFLLLHLLPGDPAPLMAGSDAPPATIEFVRHDMGLDQPLPVQYVIWLGHIARGDLGKSVFSKLPVSQLIGQRAPTTAAAPAGPVPTVRVDAATVATPAPGQGIKTGGTLRWAIIQGDLATIGVKANLKPTDPPTFTQQGLGTNPPFNGMRLSAGAFTQLFEAGSEFALSRTYGYASNAAGFYDDKWTQLASSVATEPDLTKRKQLYSDINDYLLDQSFTMAITPYPDIVGTRPNVMDLKYFLSTATNDRNMWLS